MGATRPSGPQSQRVYARLRDAIVTGEYSIGTRLPSQESLARQFGVATLTLRRALSSLEAEGFVVSHHGRGMFVLSQIPHSPEAMGSTGASQSPGFHVQFHDFVVPAFTWRLTADDWVLIDVNRAAHELTHGAAGTLIGQRCRTLFVDHPEVLEAFERCTAQRQAIRREGSWQLVSTDEQRDFLLTYVFAPPDLVMVLVEDGTKRTSAQQAPCQTEERLPDLLAVKQGSDAAPETQIAARTADIHRLQDATVALSQAMASTEVANVIVTRIIPLMGANGGSIRVVSDDGEYLEYVSGTGYAPKVIESFQQVPLSVSSPFTDAVGQRTALWIESLEDWRARYPEDSVVQSEGGHHAAAIIPLIVKGAPLGVLGIKFAGARQFDDDERRLMILVAQQCAQALERARLYDAERQRAIELQALNQELESFAYSVSHDLRSPLRGIDGFSRLLLERHADRLDDTGKEYLQRVRAATIRMSLLIDDLLNLSRVTRSELHFERVDLSEMAREILQDLRSADSDRGIDAVIQSGLMADADPRLLGVVLENLLGNAWKFTGNQDSARIEVGAYEKAGEQVYFVRDNGVGFDMTYADNLFAPFQRLHSMHEFAGSGIGLATVRRIINRHGGRTWAEAAVDRGATVSFTLGAV